MIGKDVLSRAFWALPMHEVLSLLETNADGLSEQAARERQAVFGKNLLPQRGRLSRLRILFEQFQSPLILLLAIAAGVTALLRDWKDTIFIGIAIVVNAALGFYQENKAESAIARLSNFIKEEARVFRGGREQKIDVTELIIGDIIHLTQGDRVPADCRLIHENDLQVDESILTGESLPASKSTEPSALKAVIADQHSMLFRGTSVVQGFANAAVCRVGAETELGKIAAFVAKEEHEQTPLQRAIARFGLRVSAFLLLLTVAIFIGGLTAGKPVIDMFLTSVAIAVAAIPEGLPIALTVILAIGAQRLAKKKGVVRKLLATETLGSTSVILTDKTGTLTEAKMNLSAVVVVAKQSPHGNPETILKYAAMNCDVVIENPSDKPGDWRFIGRPMEVAIVKAGAAQGILYPKIKKEIQLVDYLPFNSRNKFSASVIEHGSRHLINVYGAADVLLKYSSLSEPEQKIVLKEIHERAHSGERLLAVAIRELPHSEEVKLRDMKTYHHLEFLGLIAFRDPVRPGLREVIQRITAAGINTVIVTGDHQGTAVAVAKELGFTVAPDQVINGTDLDGLSDVQLQERLPHIRVVSRVSPEGKVRIVQGFQALGEIVAMTGDGVNDAASLKEADIGTAMGSGSDVAKDVADLVLLDDNFTTIVAAVEEGRRILENIRKVIVYLSSSIFDEMILIGGSLLFGLPLPLSAIQILFNNFVTDSFPAIGLGFEDGLDSLMEKRRRVPLNLFDKEMRFLILVIGIPTSIILFLLYWLLLRLGFDGALVRTFIFAAFSSYSLLLVFSVRSLRRPVFRYNPFSNRYLIAGVLFGLVLVAASVYWPPFQSLFGTVALPMIWALGVVGVWVFNIGAIEFGKLLIRKLNLNGYH